jgi:predicted nucleic acid-binding protein
VLLQAEQQRRLAVFGIIARFELLAALPIELDQETQDRAWREIVTLARTERLTVYDAAYLELALRKGLALASLDKALIRAAKRLGVSTLP